MMWSEILLSTQLFANSSSWEAKVRFTEVFYACVKVGEGLNVFRESGIPYYVPANVLALEIKVFT